ncbi:hypothetical protein CANARDRAFT_193591 [[Candida] arabinofermentans NRRL YB-2248]|uniref:Methyltransferase type 11 domain-containing protein n=1 Tax=[Candida] arabinofermentans NRRL YB-2248 TaxID=983967 RepID=A0A1E4T801_9ASCO|nr:hypothetical protein CANARDRAFT_193591 [[Candida] arabinofermentans NRRL YB-2248]
MSGKLQPTKEELEKETNKFKTTPTPQLQESLYVHEVYNEIAQHFSQTRYKPWPIVAGFLESQNDYNVGVDVGCGNGKYLNINNKLYMVGSDYSTGLIEQAQTLHKGEVSNDRMVADGLYLPHDSNTFDFAISIAVIHHFSTRERRVECIKEILRVLRPKGRALIYCWALEQEKSRRGYSKGMDQDVLVPWPVVEEVAPPVAETKMRFYHLYRKGELEEDCISAGSTIVDGGYERDNWWTVCEKL